MRQSSPRIFLRRILLLVLVAGFLCPRVMAASFDVWDKPEDVQVVRGDVFTMTVKNLQRASITDPETADISDAQSDMISVIGKKVGRTPLFVWDDQGKHTMMIRVMEEDLATIKMRLRTLLESSGIPKIANVWLQENENEGKVVLSGSLPEDQLTMMNRVVERFSKDIINLVRKDINEDLVQIDAQVTELNTTLSKEIGIDWSKSEDSTSVNKIRSTGLEVKETDPTNQDFFKIASFMRTSAIIAKVNALIEEGKGRILSKPRLVVLNGKEAKLLVGGEVPIKTESTVSDAGATQTYEYKEYGVTMAITPTVRNGKIDVLMNVEIRDLDSANAQGGNVAFLTRTAQTRLFLDDRQTIVLAGMIRKSSSETTTRVAGLSKIPVLGALFRNNKIQPASEDKEVVISLTPTIISSSSAPLAQLMVSPQVVGSSVSEGLLSEGGRNNRTLPVITKNVATVPTKISGDFRDYAATVQKRISEAVAYPSEARDNGWQGTVKLGLVIRMDGSLRDAFVQESSGYEVLDQDAVNTAHLVAPYAPFSEDIGQDKISITLPIVYSTDKFLKNIVTRN
ncbi:MAG: TonB family protein [Candidatus Omnitrophica bacterium]|nr:TonB family protein [Candidatus Omnitrophota bacterium]